MIITEYVPLEPGTYERLATIHRNSPAVLVQEYSQRVFPTVNEFLASGYLYYPSIVVVVPPQPYFSVMVFNTFGDIGLHKIQEIQIERVLVNYEKRERHNE